MKKVHKCDNYTNLAGRVSTEKLPIEFIAIPLALEVYTGKGGVGVVAYSAPKMNTLYPQGVHYRLSSSHSKLLFSIVLYA